MAPESGGREPAAVKILLDTGSGLISISERLVARMQRVYPGEVLVKSFQGTACVRTSFGKELPVSSRPCLWGT